MSAVLEKSDPVRPRKTSETPVPAVLIVDESDSGRSSVQYSRYRTKLSNRRTGLSEHRTSSSEYRTDLSGLVRHRAAGRRHCLSGVLYDRPPQRARGDGSAKSHHAESAYPPSLTLITALILLAIGIVAVLSMVFSRGPILLMRIFMIEPRHGHQRGLPGNGGCDCVWNEAVLSLRVEG